MSETVKSRRKREDMPVRKEAEDFRQARGMDTQAMVPVLAAIASILSMLCFRWVSVPDLRYTPYSHTAGFGSWRRRQRELPGITGPRTV